MVIGRGAERVGTAWGLKVYADMGSDLSFGTQDEQSFGLGDVVTARES